MLALAIIAWVAGFVLFSSHISTMQEPGSIEKTDAIIALTGGAKRVDRALDLFAEGASRHLLISGVHQDVKLKELLALWNYHEKLPDCCITLGYEAGNTLGNAIEARNWTRDNHIKTIRLVTASYHMPRALLEFHHMIPDVEIMPHPIEVEGFAPEGRKFWELSFLEYHKYLMSFLRIMFYPQETHPLPEALKK